MREKAATRSERLRPPSRRGATGVGILLLAAALGCERHSGGTAPAASGSAPISSAGPAASVAKPSAKKLAAGIPVPEEKVRKAVNPKSEKPYSGPVGTITGVITIRGDEAPELEDVLKKIPEREECQPARDMYGQLFREGMMRSLADALVTVTEYDGYVPARAVAQQVTVKGCSFGTRTLAVTYGQRLEVFNRGFKSVLPKLFGANHPAVLVAIPGGDPINIYPDRAAAKYRLGEAGHDYMAADVFVLKFATFAVTDLDGKYRIEGVPAGEVSVRALLPVIGQHSGKRVEVESGKETRVDLEIFFDADEHLPKTKPPKPAAPPALR